MNELGLKTKLIGSFLFAALLSAIIGGMGLWQQHRMLNTTRSIVRDNFPQMVHLAEMKRASREAIGLFIQLNIVGADEKEQTRVKEKIAKTFKEIDGEITELTTFADLEDEKKDIADLNKQYTLVKSEINQMIETAAASDYASHQKLGEFYRGQFKTDRFALYAIYDGMTKRYQANLDTIVSNAETESRNAVLLTTFFVIFGAFFVILIGFFLSRRLHKDLSQISEVLKDEGASLGSNSETLGGIATSLADSITQQASAIQQTAASLEEITAMVGKTAENAKNSQRITLQTSERVKMGRESVLHVSDAMNGIQASNDNLQRQMELSNADLSEIVAMITEIENKTNVINDIVFQTRLLSFNASVEAARAGEHGKGFTVVAEEVGSLAQLSGTSATEIKQILEKSVRRVQEIIAHSQSSVNDLMNSSREKIRDGVQVSQKSAELLDKLIQDVSEINVMAAEIATASDEQSQGVSEINKAISSFEKSTQKNSASSQETSAMVGELKQTSDKTRGVIEQLHTTLAGKKAA